MEVITKTLDGKKPLFYVFVSGFGFAVQSLVVKLLSEGGMHLSMPCIFFRGICQTALSLYIIHTNGESEKDYGLHLFGDTWNVRFTLLLRSVLGYIGLHGALMAVEYMSVGDSTTLVMLSPIIAAIGAYILLGEPWRLPEFIAAFCGLLGGIFISRPSFIFGAQDSEQENSSRTFALGVTLSLIAALAAGFAYVFVRMLGTTFKMHWANICLAQSLVQVLFSIPSMYIFGQMYLFGLPFDVYCMLMAAGTVGSVSQVLLTIGLQREKSASATAMLTSEVVFGYMLQVVFTHDAVSWLSIVGATLVSIGILVVLLLKPANSSSSQSH
eukprot:gene37483-45519_t